MPLIRGHHSFDDHFTQIPNDWLRDTRLSLKSIGLLAQIMSHNPGWNMSIRALAKANGTGVDTIKSAILELEANGYLVRSEKQKQNEDGTFADYDFVTQDPFQNPVTGKTRHGEMEHKEEHNSLEEHISENNKRTNAHFVKPFEMFWEIYPKKLDKGKARKAFVKAMQIASVEEILDGARRYAEDPNLPESQFVKYPATWLNAESWTNGPLPPRRTTEQQRREEEIRRLYESEGD